MPLRLLCITAHPDDESMIFGGALMTAHREGVETSLLCLTDGQAAHNRGEAADSKELGRIRRAELAVACELLGITQHEVLQYPDGALLREDFYALAGVITERIRKVRPQVVLTFGGDGSVNLHRDHTMVAMAATAAFHWAGRAEFFPEQAERGVAPYTPQKLYYTYTPYVMVRDHPELAEAPTVPWSLSLDVDDLWEKKIGAFALHGTQRGAMERVREVAEQHRRTERYLLVAAPGKINVTEDNALFAGVTPD